MSPKNSDCLTTRLHPTPQTFEQDCKTTQQGEGPLKEASVLGLIQSEEILLSDTKGSFSLDTVPCPQTTDILRF